MSDAFFTLYQGLDREGPGEAADVRWALDRLGLRGGIRVCDAGAGSGADTFTLAQCLPGAWIDAVEKAPSFVAQAKRRCAGFGARVTVRQGDMARLEGRYDLIWCAGAMYFLGIGAGLSGWRDALVPGGYVAFSQPVFLDDPPGAAARDFWVAAEYPDITGLDGIRARVEDAGFRVLDHRMIVGAGWARYYKSLRARIDRLRPTAGPDLLAVLDEVEMEIGQWRNGADQIAYALVLAQVG